MKKIVVLAFAVIVSLATFAQKEENVLEAMRQPIDISVKETSVKLNKENRPVFTTYIAANTKEVAKQWKKYFEEKYTIEFEKDKDVMKAPSVKIPELTVETVNLIGRVTEDEKGSRLDMALDFGTKYLSAKDDSETAAKFEAMMTTFVNEFYVGWYATVLEEERKKVSKAEKVLTKAVKTEENLAKDIEGKIKDATKAEETIAKSEEEIVDLQAKIEMLKADIIKYKSEAESLKGEKSKQAEVIASQKQVVAEMQKQLEMIKMNADKIQAGK